MLSGKAVSLIGTAVYNYAISLYVLKTTGSAMSFAANIMFGMLPGAILGAFAGIIVDAFNRKMLLIVMDILSGATVLSLYVYASIHTLNLTGIYLTATLLSVFGIFFMVTNDASIPDLIEDRRLNRANSLSKSIDSFSNIAGPILGGFIFALVDIKLFLLIDGISFLLSALASSFLRFRPSAAARKPADSNRRLSAKGALTDIRKGVSLIRNDQVVFTLFGFIILINFLIYFGFNIPVPYMINNVLKLSPSQYGIITGSSPVGILICSVILSALPEFKNRRRVFTVAFAGLAFMIALSGLPVISASFFSKSVSFIYYMMDYLLFGVMVILVNIPMQTLMQRRVSDEYRGRVFGLLRSFSMAAIPLGCILSGYLIDKIPPYFLPIASGVFLLVLIVSFRNKDAMEKM